MRRRARAAAALAAAVLFAACGHREASRTAPPAVTASPASAPRGSAPVPASAARTERGSSTTAGPGAAFTASPAQPRSGSVAPPQILSVSVSPVTVRSGSVVSAVVSTTPGVVAVTAFAGGQAVGVPRVGVGRFAGSTTIPELPPFVHGPFPVTFRARDARGATTQTAFSVTVP